MTKNYYDQFHRMLTTAGQGYPYLVKKLQDKGYTFVEQPVHHYARHTGRSSFFRPRHLYEMGREFLRMWWGMMLKPRLHRHG